MLIKSCCSRICKHIYTFLFDDHIVEDKTVEEAIPRIRYKNTEMPYGIHQSHYILNM